LSLPPLLFQTKIKRRLMPLVNKYAPKGSKRRNLIARCYYKIRRTVLG